MSRRITPDRLDSLFRPRSVALVGAANKSMFSQIAYRNLVEFGMAEQTYLVNRRGAETHGRKTFTSCRDIGEPVDVAYLMVPQSGTLDALSEAAAAGIHNAVILSSGYGEAGEEGRRAEAELVAHAESLDMVLLGPNHLGFANFADRKPVVSVPGLPQRAGSVALLSQSGASSAAMLDFAKMSGSELSYLVTLGNEAMITAGHVLDYLVDDEATRAVAIFMETIRDPDTFRRAARRAAAAGKAVVVLKAGSSELSARTAAAHTGALVGDHRTIDAVFADLGVIRVDSIEDMLITAGAAAQLGRLARPGVGVVSISGGACDIIADRAEDHAMPLPELAEQTRATVAEVMPGYGTVQNPLDITGAAIIDPSLWPKTISALSSDPSIGVVMAVNGLPWERAAGPYQAQTFVNAIGAGIEQAAVPVVYVNQVMQPITEYTREIMAEGRIPFAINGLRQAVSALGKLAWWSQVTAGAVAEPSAVTVPPAGERRGAWSEYAARKLLSEAGIPVVPAVLARSADEAARAAVKFGEPVAVKLVSPDVLHKSDIGGVRLAVRGEASAREAYEAVTAAAKSVAGARVEGALVSPMRGDALELLVGVVADPQWGPMLAVALGGIFVEVLKDSALAPVPVSAERAEQLLRGLRGAALLDGARGTKPADVPALARVVARVSDLAYALGADLESLEINPLRVDGSVIEALDAVVTWKEN